MKNGSIAFVCTGIFLCFCACAPRMDEEARIQKAMHIHDRVWAVDTHCDTPMRMGHDGFDVGQRHESGMRESGCVDFPRMADGGLDAQFFAVFLGQEERTPEKHALMKAFADSTIQLVKDACLRNPSLAELALSPEDAVRLEKNGKRAIFLGLENGYPIGTDLSLVSHFYDAGIRYITLCHNGNNEICDSSTDDVLEWNGLSPFGEKVVAEMNRLGMIIDVSHVSDETFYDVIETSRAPVVATHSCCRALCDVPRNMTDDMLIALKKNHGVIQICFVSSFVKAMPENTERRDALRALRAKYGEYDQITDVRIRERVRKEFYEIYDKYPWPRATVAEMADHIDHVVKLIGIDHVGIGTDFDGGGELEGCRDVSELANVTKELLSRGYSRSDIRKIWGGNFMRVFKQIIKTGENLRRS